MVNAMKIRRDTNISLYSVRMRENADQNNSDYGQFLRSVHVLKSRLLFLKTT